MEQEVSAVMIAGHGIGGVLARKYHAPIRDRFGFAKIYSLPELGRPRILDASRVLADQISGEYGDQPLVLIAHSEGGLVAVELAHMLQEQVLRVVAMSTPFEGTNWAFLARSPIGRLLVPSHRDMSPGSAYLHDLKANRLAAVKPKLATLAFGYDRIVPWRSTYVEGADRNYLVGDPTLHRTALAEGYSVTPVPGSQWGVGEGHIIGPLTLNGSVRELLDETWAQSQKGLNST